MKFIGISFRSILSTFLFILVLQLGMNLLLNVKTISMDNFSFAALFMSYHIFMFIIFKASTSTKYLNKFIHLLHHVHFYTMYFYAPSVWWHNNFLENKMIHDHSNCSNFYIVFFCYSWSMADYVYSANILKFYCHKQIDILSFYSNII